MSKSVSDGPETWEGILKLPHDATLTMEQVNSELNVHGNTSVGWLLQAAPKLSVGLENLSIRCPVFMSKSGSDGARDPGKHSKAAS